MGNPSLPPIGKSTTDGVDIVSIQFIPPYKFRVEFNFQINSELAKKLLFTKARAWDLLKLSVTSDGAHIWYVEPNVINGGRAPALSSLSDLITPQLRYHIENEDVSRQTILSKKEWLQEQYNEYSKLHREYVVNTLAWGNTRHPCGLRFKEIMDLEDGTHEIGGWWIWRGKWADGSRGHDGFQDFRISPYERYNDDIRDYLSGGRNLRQAVKDQDDDWMYNFYTFLGSLATFYSASPSAGARPPPPSAGVRPPTRLTQPSRSKLKGLDKGFKKLDRAAENATNVYGTFVEIRDAVKHAKRVQAVKELEIIIKRDTENLGNLYADLLNEAPNSDQSSE